MKTLHQVFFLFVISFISTTLFSQSATLDSLQVERIAKTCQLWGHLKYFHPQLDGETVDWERAFTNNIGQVIAAKNSDDFGKAVQSMLLPLNDSATKVLIPKKEEKEKNLEKYPKISFIQDSILLIAIKDYSDLEDYPYCMELFRSLRTKLPLSKGVIFDLRSPKSTTWNKGYISYYFSQIEAYLSKEKLQIPGFKARFHDGFKPETGNTSGGYDSGYYIKGQRTIDPKPTAIDQTIVFVVNEYAEVPPIAIALQNLGKGVILSQGGLSDDAIVTTATFVMEEGVVVNVRLNELAAEKGLEADYSLKKDIEDKEVINTAVQLIKRQQIAQTALIPNKEMTTADNVNLKANASVSSYPDLSHRLLAAAKIWTVIDYFFAYKDLMENDWEEVLKTYIPKLALAADSLAYHLSIAEMYQHIQDGHGFIRSQVLNDYWGTAVPPIVIRLVEEQAVVTSIFPDSIVEVKGIEVGDIILEIDGEKTEDKAQRYANYLAHSNPSWLKNVLSSRLLSGKEGTQVVLKIKNKTAKIEEVRLPRNNKFQQYARQYSKGRNDSPITRFIDENIGYADLDRLKVDRVDAMFEKFKNTKAIIFDMRGYPNGTAWEIAPHLTDKTPVFAAQFKRYSPMSMGLMAEASKSENITTFNQSIPPTKLPHYTGKTLMLIDERTISQAEHTGLFFEAANGTKFIGSQTAGANGDVTNFKIPGNMTLFFSGHDVKHIDGRQLQKVGLVPDVEVQPTIEGIRAGKDEVLERAIEYAKTLIMKR